jgi:hypothetical protein
VSEFKNFTQGLFEILLPGSFLFVNLIVFVCVTGGAGSLDQLRGVAEKWGLVEAIPILGVSYILGMILRMFRTEIPDLVSAWCLGHIPPRLKEPNYLKDRFFYKEWMTERYMPSLKLPAATKFFKEEWAYRYQDPGLGLRNPNTQFINFMKTMLLTIDKDISAQLSATEAVSRFVASSFWALLICAGLLTIDSCLLLAQGRGDEARVSLVLLLVYVAVLYGVVRHFRYLRCKEVCMVFDASFAHRNDLRKLLKSDNEQASSDSNPPPSKTKME